MLDVTKSSGDRQPRANVLEIRVGKHLTPEQGFIRSTPHGWREQLYVKAGKYQKNQQETLWTTVPRGLCLHAGSYDQMRM